MKCLILKPANVVKRNGKVKSSWPLWLDQSNSKYRSDVRFLCPREIARRTDRSKDKWRYCNWSISSSPYLSPEDQMVMNISNEWIFQLTLMAYLRYIPNNTKATKLMNRMNDRSNRRSERGYLPWQLMSYYLERDQMNWNERRFESTTTSIAMLTGPNSRDGRWSSSQNEFSAILNERKMSFSDANASNSWLPLAIAAERSEGL